MERCKIVLLGVITLCMFLAIPQVSGNGRMVGGRTEVKDVKTNKEVQELGRFSVKQFNKQLHRKGNDGSALVFTEVVEAQKQVVSGLKYYLRIRATTKTGETKIFDSVVVVKPWLNVRELLKFEPVVKLLITK